MADESLRWSALRRHSSLLRFGGTKTQGTQGSSRGRRYRSAIAGLSDFRLTFCFKWRLCTKVGRATRQRTLDAVGVGLLLRSRFEHMRAAGVEFLTQPRTEHYGRFVVFRDIAGNRWDLIGPQPRP